MVKEYWDTNLFLSYLQNKPEERERVEIIAALLRRAESGDTQIVFSALGIAEIRPRSDYDPIYNDVINDLFHADRPYLKLVSVSPRIGNLAASIGGQNPQITSPDAVHVATALSERVDVMLTLDGFRDNEIRRSGGLLAFDGKIGSPPLRIESPTRPPDSQIELPEGNQ